MEIIELIKENESYNIFNSEMMKIFDEIKNKDGDIVLKFFSSSIDENEICFISSIIDDADKTILYRGEYYSDILEDNDDFLKTKSNYFINEFNYGENENQPCFSYKSIIEDKNIVEISNKKIKNKTI